MAEFDINVGNRRHRTLSFTKADGSPGEVDNPPLWESDDATLALMDVDTDGMRGTIAHNGSVGDFTVTSRADGDLGIGVNPIVISDIFHMLAPLGATGGGSTVGEEEPIPTP